LGPGTHPERSGALGEACGEKRAGAATTTDGSHYLVRMDKDDAMRMQDLKPGDRVRITRRIRLTGYLPGIGAR
jgi:hypothetical protein